MITNPTIIASFGLLSFNEMFRVRNQKNPKLKNKCFTVSFIIYKLKKKKMVQKTNLLMVQSSEKLS
jgi:hypothetical protein